ncbi:hypothetical protein GQ457_02G027570 [Hibiscus cannabinus]
MGIALDDLCIFYGHESETVPAFQGSSEPNHVLLWKLQYRVPIVEELTLERCLELKEFIGQTGNQSGIQALFNEKVHFPSLERMTISELRNVKMKFHNDLAPGSLRKLKDIEVGSCVELLSIFSPTMVKDVAQLDHMRIRDCGVSEKTDIDGKWVKLTWLKSAFEHDGNSSNREVDCPERAYILLLIGGMLMPDKSSTMVHTQYLPFFVVIMECQFIQLGINNFGISISRDVQGIEDVKRRWSSVECRYLWLYGVALVVGLV